MAKSDDKEASPAARIGTNWQRFVEFLVVVIAAALLVAHTFRLWNLRVDSVTLALLGLLLVAPLSRFVTKIKLGEFEAELVDRAKRKANAELLAIKEVVQGPAEASGASRSSGRARADVGQDREHENREIIAHYMGVAAEWGWNMAHAGFKEPPEPVLEWDTDGYPRILYGQSQTLSGDALRRAAARRRERLREERTSGNRRFESSD